jgi:hypothetical protein
MKIKPTLLLLILRALFVNTSPAAPLSTAFTYQGLLTDGGGAANGLYESAHGPMAQDFKAAFGVGETDTGITSVDADGVALAAISRP